MLNLEFKIHNLISWIKNQSKNRNKSTILIEIDNTVACIVNILLAKKTGLAVHTVIDSLNANTKESLELCDFLNLDSTIISYDNQEDNFNVIFDKRISYIENKDIKCDLDKNAKISYIGEISNSLVLSNITRDDYLFVRNYSKLQSWDAMPFAGLSGSIVRNLLDELISVTSLPIKNILNIAPKPNPNMEWIFSTNEKNGIIESEEDPTKNPKWYMFTIDQKQLIAKIHQIEKITRYKENKNIPVFNM